MKLVAILSTLLVIELAAPRLACAEGGAPVSSSGPKIELAQQPVVDACNRSCGLSILNKIDTSPAFGMTSPNPGSSKKNGARKVFNYILDTRGSDVSKEGADIATDKVSDVRSSTTEFYRSQLKRDELHWQVVTLIARIASLFGQSEKTPADTVGYVNGLRILIGEEETEIVLTTLTSSGIDQARRELANVRPLDLPQTLDLEEAMLASALEMDPILASVRQELQPYNNISKDRRTTTKVTYTGLEIAGFVPTIVAPIAQTALLGVVMANGGSEQDKLLKEVYFAKRYEKRRELVQKELRLALDARQIGIASKNATLYHFGQELTKHLCGDQLALHLFCPAMVAARRNQPNNSFASSTQHQTQ
jgi:hypothetical protein